jgi:membrane associated rhomboid family serine protease
MSVVNLNITKAKVVKVVEYAVIGFVSAFVASWVHQPNPFSKSAVIAGLSAAVGAIVGILRGLTSL